MIGVPQRKGGAGQRAPLRLPRSALQADSPAMLDLASRRRTRSVAPAARLHLYEAVLRNQPLARGFAPPDHRAS